MADSRDLTDAQWALIDARKIGYFTDCRCFKYLSRTVYSRQS